MDLRDWPYQLKSARRKKRLVRKDFDKQLISLRKRDQELWLQKRLLPMVPLERPYQRGWKSDFVLSDRTKRSDKADFYQQLLDKINTRKFHYDASFKVKNKKKRKYGLSLIPQELQWFSEREWNSSRVELSADERLCFLKTEIWSSDMNYSTIRYVYNHPADFVLKVSPYIISEVKLLDTDLEREIAAIRNFIDHRDLWPKIHKLTIGKRYRYRAWSETNLPKYINKLKNKPMYTDKEVYMD